MSLLGKLSLLKFKYGLNRAKKRAIKLYNDKQGSVVCEYCNKLLPKEEAGITYDIDRDCLEFYHEDCFQKYAPHGGDTIKPKE